MNILNDGLYLHYSGYIKQKFDDNKISIGELKLLLISMNKFEQYKIRYIKDESFRNIQDELYAYNKRLEVIDNILKKIDDK